MDVQNERESLRNKISAAERGIHRAELAYRSALEEKTKRENLQLKVNELAEELSEAEKLVQVSWLDLCFPLAQSRTTSIF